MRVPNKALLSGAVTALVILVVVGNIYVTNRLIERDQPAVSIVPGTPIKGDKGDKGDRPTAQEVQQAVSEYCSSTGACQGRSPSLENVYSAVARFCEANTCRGATGIAGMDGKDAAQVTIDQIQTEVAAYCASAQCVGTDGADGADGLQGDSGEAGQSPVMACVLRSGAAGVDARYVAWKYAEDEDEQYKDLYKLPVWAECSNPVDLRQTA